MVLIRGSQFLEDRAVRTIVAVTVGGELCQRIAHIGQFGDAFIELRYVLERDHLHLCACSRTVLPERQKLAHIVNKKTKATRLPDEFQQVDLVAAVSAITRVSTLDRLDQADTFVITNHLCADARCARGFTDIHVALLIKFFQILAR
ncbi:hypothetical protein XF14_35665 [Burkholderia gladioli]|nr:hypothetical protein XF14_35665 [Burkholderia gladioli]